MATPTPPAQPLPRDNTLRVGFVAAFSALAGAVVAGIFTFAATDRQVNGQSAEAQREFIRSQREVTYTKFLNADHVYLDLTTNENLAIIRNSYNPSHGFDALRTAQAQLQDDAEEVSIIGSPQAANSAQHVADDAEVLFQDISQIGQSNPKVVSKQTKVLITDMTKQTLQFVTDQHAFAADSRTDLGVGRN